MCRTQCLLALVALYVGLAHSWDIAVGVGNQLIFYTDGTKTNTVNFVSRNVTALAYDEVYNRMLYVDKQRNYDAICSFNLYSEETECFIERTGSNINSIAFDPATKKLFFTDTNDNSINSISLKPGYVNNVNANLIIKMDDRTPSDIAVDSCTGYIYWINTNNKNNLQDNIERARFNGSERENIIRYINSDMVTLVIDPQTRKINYFANSSSYFLYLEHTDFNGRDEHVIYTNGHSMAVKELTVSQDNLYWVNSSESYTTVWQLPKNTSNDKEPNKISTFYTEKQPALAANYKIEDQIQDLQDCEALSILIPTITVTNNSLAKRCEVSGYHNYCLQGNCSLNHEGLPICSCNAGYTGKRCEVYACQTYCWNDGECSLNEEDEPVCQCAANHEGSRCETDTSGIATDTPTYDLAKRNLTLVDLLSRWRKPSSKMFLVVEV